MELITYGHHLTKERFVEAHTLLDRLSMNKPGGGIWASPINSKHSWKEWCLGEDFRTNSLKRHTRFKLKDSARILTISDVGSLMLALRKYGRVHQYLGDRYLDWDKIKEDYDVVHLTAYGEISTRYTRPSMYGWDCESVVILRWDVIDEQTIEKG